MTSEPLAGGGAATDGRRTLESVLIRYMDPSHFLQLAIGITAALAELHRQNIVHKNLNPGTVLIDPATSTITLTGFSTQVVPSAQSVIASGDMEVRPAYMSPEQTGRINRVVDQRSDLYSLGVTLYQMLTGTLPCQAGCILEWVHCHIARSPRPPMEVVPETPRMLSDIVMKLLAKDSEERYQTASGLKVDLERCLSQWEAAKEIEPFPLGKFDIPDRLLIPQNLYGREKDFDALIGAFNRVAASGVPEIVMVVGSSGIGKTSLVKELHKPIVKERGFFVSGKFDQYKRDIPYATIAEAFRELIQQILTDSRERIAEWKRQLQQAFGVNGRLIVDIIPQMELIVGPQPPLPELPPTEAQDRFNMVFRQFMGVIFIQEHPLVVFLDDLQWVDSATITLLEHLITHPDTRFLLLIGAYRENEVGPSHPLLLMLDNIRKSRGTVQTITLSPFSFDDLSHLLTDAFHSEQARVEPLTRLVHEKTGGNPFFVIQFLMTLYGEGLVVFDRTAYLWKWDIPGIREKGYTDNVVDLMVGKLRRLSDRSLQEMRVAACIGNTFDLRTLSVISSMSEDETREHLREAVQEGLVLFLTETSYRFLHDRVQEAAYSLVPEVDRPGLHLRIGRLLLANMPEDRLEKNVFDIMSHFSLGAALITEQGEMTRVAALSLHAARKAKSSTAYRVAVGYLSAGAALLEDPWEDHYELAYALLLERAECESLSGAFDEAERLFPVLLQHARTRVDKGAVYRVKIDTHTIKGEDGKAIESALECLRIFGIEMSPHPSAAEVEEGYREVWRNLGIRNIEELIDLPLMTDPEMRAAMEVLACLYAPAYHSDNNLFYLHLSHGVNLSLMHGNSPASTHAYGWFGIVLACVFHRSQDGYRFAKLAFDLMERHHFLEYKAKAYFQLRIISYWTQPLDTMLEYSRAAFEAAVETGDVPVACFSCNHTVMGMLIRGDHLSEVHREAERGLDFVQRAGFRDVYDMVRGIERFIQAVRGHTRHLSTYDDDGFSEAEFEVGLGSNRMPTLVFYYYVVKLMARFLSGDYEAALKAGEKSSALLWAGLFSAQGHCFYFFYALTLASVFDDLPPEKQKETLELLTLYCEQLREPAENNPPTFYHHEALVSAEIARIRGQSDEAMRLYEQAIRSARDNGFVQDEAISCELAARFYRARGFEEIADTYLRYARSCYERWGAAGKVKQLDEQYPWLHEKERALAGAPFGQVDAITVVKASQAISGEIMIFNLLDTLMRIVIENAGAQVACLLLTRGDDLWIEAQARVEGEGIEFLRPHRPPGPADLPLSIVNYVRRTRESVILGDASERSMFSSDDYISLNRPVSVLCLPVMRQANLIGLLYLENDLLKGAFTSERVAVLEVLAAQAAMSLENARMYEALRESEELSRTRLAELKTIYATAPIGLCFMDTNFRFVSINEELAKINGLAVEEHLGRTLREVLPDIADYIEPSYREVIETGSTVEGLEIHGTTRAQPGVERDWLANFYPVKDAADGVVGINVVVQEVTARKQAEEALREAETKYRSLFVNAVDGIYRTTRTGQFIDANPAMARMLGYDSPEELVAGINSIAQQLYVVPEQRWELTRLLEKHDVVERFETQLYRKNGSVIWVSLCARAIRDSTGQVLYYEGTAEDITERKRAEDALRFSEARYRTLHRDIPTMIFTLDTEGTVLSVNPFGASQLGYAVEELEGQPVLNVFYEGDRPAVADQLRKCLQDPNRVYSWQFRKIRKDGALLWVEELAQAVYSLNGVLNVLVVCQDVTERKRAEETLRKVHEELEQRVVERTRELTEANAKLKELDRLKSMFIASMSHELRTPLNSVIGFSSIVLNEWAGPLNPEQKENLTAILRSGRHLLALLNDVIDVSKIEAGKIEPVVERFDLYDLITEAVELVTNDAQGKGLQLKVEALHLKMNTDRRRLLQCMLNLLTNAVKFTEKGSVRVGVQVPEDDKELVEIMIEDTGIGIRQEDLPKLFQPFVRLVPPHHAIIPGTGLGLYLTRRLVVEVLKGDVACVSRFGEGSTFTLKIPARSV